MKGKITVEYIRKFANTCGFDFEDEHGKYELKTPYGSYKRKTLKEIESIIIRDNRRFSTSRF